MPSAVKFSETFQVTAELPPESWISPWSKVRVEVFDRV